MFEEISNSSADILVSFSKLSKQLVLKLQEETVHIIPNNTDDTLVCFSALSVVSSSLPFKGMCCA